MIGALLSKVVGLGLFMRRELCQQLAA